MMGWHLAQKPRVGFAKQQNGRLPVAFTRPNSIQINSRPKPTGKCHLGRRDCQPAFAQSTTDVLLEWNRILNTALATPGAVPPTVFVTRPASITSIAVFDALNSIDPLYTPYVSGVNVPAGASREAAIAQAAHDAMVAMMPSQAATFGAALASTLSRIDPAEIQVRIK